MSSERRPRRWWPRSGIPQLFGEREPLFQGWLHHFVAAPATAMLCRRRAPTDADRPAIGAAFIRTHAATRVRAARGVNRPPELPVPESSTALTYPVGRTVLVRGENRHDSGLSRGENRQNY
jgi:hypothetical protein